MQLFWKELFSMQRILDEKIERKHELDISNLFEEQISALLVEIGELENEERSFKYWSVKPKSGRNTVLEEFIDCVHFMLTIGNVKGFNETFDYYSKINIHREPIVILFNNFFEAVVFFRRKPTILNYIIMWEYLLSIGKKLGFTEKTIFDAYILKNSVNHERQNSNY